MAATKVPCTLSKPGTMRGTPKKLTAGTPIASFAISDDPNAPGTGNYLVNGTNAAGEVVDVSTLATIAIVDDASGNAASTVTGANTFSEQGKKAGTSVATITMTFTAGSPGPFSGDVQFNVSPGGVTGFTVTPILPPTPAPTPVTP